MQESPNKLGENQGKAMNFSRSIQWLLNVAFLSPSLHIFMVNSRYFLVAFKGKPQIPMLKAHHFP